jgi:hypothetical protein
MEAGNERLVVSLHRGSGFSAEFEFNEGVKGNALIAFSGISIDRIALRKIVQELREQGALD